MAVVACFTSTSSLTAGFCWCSAAWMTDGGAAEVDAMGSCSTLITWGAAGPETEIGIMGGGAALPSASQSLFPMTSKMPRFRLCVVFLLMKFLTPATI